ncbi:hypothetical protein SeLEV6574_g03425 [Synchytrium endobioticum]|uniref:RRM domain-containing protein n=1 Tax=Synchytrium endobioticum TaxID=286115 RepID=A0A507D3M5_9FUNG|nr:hypothetical protein SeLEV6574_g03425 [Synchytrium endobioticum]
MAQSPPPQPPPASVIAPPVISPPPETLARPSPKGLSPPLVSSSTQTDLPMFSTTAPSIFKTPQMPKRSLAPTHYKPPHPLVRSSSTSHVLSSSTSVVSSSPPAISLSSLRELTQSVEALGLDHCNSIGRSYSAPSSPMEKPNDIVHGSPASRVDETFDSESKNGYESDDEGSSGQEEQDFRVYKGVDGHDNEPGPRKSSDDQEQKNDPDPQKGLPAACLFVASLSSSRTDDQLQESVTNHFEQWGILLHVKVLKDVMSRPYAFVQYENPEDAKRALTAAHNTTVDGRRIRVEQARVNRTLFLAKFGRQSSDNSVEGHERQLLEVLGKYGPVEELTVLADEYSRSRNCAYVKFAYRDDAIRAFIGVRRNYKWICEWCDTNLNLNSTSAEYPEVPEYETQDFVEHNSIFVGNLNPSKVTYQLLEQRFGEYGTITGLRLMDTAKNGGGLVKPAFAFVTYKDEESAYRAVEEANGKSWLDKPLRVQMREPPDTSRHRMNMSQQQYAMMAGHPPPGTSGMFQQHMGAQVGQLPSVRFTSAPPSHNMMPLAPPTPLYMPPPYPSFHPSYTPPPMGLHRSSVSSNGSSESSFSETSSLGPTGGSNGVSSTLNNPNAPEFVPVTPVTPPLSPVRMRVLSSDTGPLFVPAYDYEEQLMESPMIPYPNMISLPPNFNPAHLQPMQHFAPPGLPPLQHPHTQSSTGLMQPPPALNHNHQLHQRQTSAGSAVMTPLTPQLYHPGGCENMPPSPMSTPGLPYLFPFGLPPPGLSFIPPPPPQPVHNIAPSPQFNSIRPISQQPMFAGPVGNGARQRMRSGGYGGLRSPTNRPYNPIHPVHGAPGATPAANNMGNGVAMATGEVKKAW